MARRTSFSFPFTTTLMLALLLSAAVSIAGGGVSGGEIQLDWMSPATSSVCEGTVGECAVEEEEEIVDSETNRRMLAWRGRYISYGALRRNFIPCSRRGQSYYFCRPGAAVNPYHRGCSQITRCRS